jgi:predicted Mrr-cat superfamily restriction endonuclease
MSKAWLVRPLPNDKNRIEEFKSSNIVAVGWPLIGDLTGKSREEIKLILQAPPYNYSSLKLGNAYATIDILVNQMSIGDLVLIPNGDDIYFAKINSNYHYEKSKDTNDEGYPHQRKVSFLAGPIARSQLPESLRKSLKVHRATADLSKHYDTIKSLSEGNTIISTCSTYSNEFTDVEYPIRPGVVVKLSIPNNINQSEASRLSDFVKTLYFQ